MGFHLELSGLRLNSLCENKLCFTFFFFLGKLSVNFCFLCLLHTLTYIQSHKNFPGGKKKHPKSRIIMMESKLSSKYLPLTQHQNLRKPCKMSSGNAQHGKEQHGQEPNFQPYFLHFPTWWLHPLA